MDNEKRCRSYKGEVAKGGISFGCALAMVISFTVNKSVLWAIIHGVLGWLYVLYYVIFVR
jgi:hypothetical protein